MYKLLLVDDETANLRLLERLFSRDYDCLTASSGADAIRILEQHDVAIVITDQRMPEMTGIELLKRTAALRPHMVRILLTGYTDVEALVEAINCGLVYMYFTKPWNNDDLKLKVSRAREHYENNKKHSALMLANDRLVSSLKEIKQTIVNSLVDMMKSRNGQAYAHSGRVRNQALLVALGMDLGEEERDNLAAAALLHNLGPVETSMRKRRAVTGNETQTQVECEAQLLAAIPELSGVMEIIRHQSENFDGSGHPLGLKGEEISQPARILRVVMEYDSMIMPKESVAAMTHEEAMRFLVQRSERQFDPKVIEAVSQTNLDSPSRNLSNSPLQPTANSLSAV